MIETRIEKDTKCFHCGDKTGSDTIRFDDHDFCCQGCRNVYELLSSNNLCDYYNLEGTPGITQRNPVAASKFNYLDDEEVQRKLIDFKDSKITRVTFFIPVMHCSSCIWLLEHLYKLDNAVVNARVNFMKKNLTLTFSSGAGSLRSMVQLLSSLGYEPAINLNDIETDVKQTADRRLLYRMGVAGFCFGNIMLISFPEYFGLDRFTRGEFAHLFGYLNMALSLPVFFYSARDYFVSAIKGLYARVVSIDVPLALGILVLFVRSAYEVISQTGIGYFDTHAGLVFFLLIGKWFRQKTFDTLSFERDYKSYFPVAVSCIQNGEEKTVPVNNLKIGDRIVIRNSELIPADSILLRGDANIDFSFVTGESDPVNKVVGEMIYAGGRQTGSTIELEVCRKVSQSYLTQLWNNETFAKPQEGRIKTFQQTVSKYFTAVLLLVAFGSAAFWLWADASLAWNAFTAVLIIACPCALALSSPFALGTAMRILGRMGFYVKSPEVIEQIARIDTIVFDKTGTITRSAESTIHFAGGSLSEWEKMLIASLAKQSVHPLSQKIVSFLGHVPMCEVKNFIEINGKGLTGELNGVPVQLGSFAYVFPEKESGFFAAENPDALATRVYVKIDGHVAGYFQVLHTYREGLKNVLDELKTKTDLYLLSGDNESERLRLTGYFGQTDHLHFRQSPVDKLNFIENLKGKGRHVMMVGDGLNDAGALKAGDVGVSVTENTAHFSPASDVIMDAALFSRLPSFLRFMRNTRSVIHGSFCISLIYNIIGLSFAVQGTLSPLIAAILMPLSSVSVIAFTTISTSLFAHKQKLS